MTRISDMGEEKRAAHFARINQTFDRLDALDASLAEGAERRQEALFEERHAERMRERREREREASQQPQQRQQQRPQTVPARDWEAERRWVEGVAGRRIAAHLEPLAKEIGGVCGKHERRIRELEDRLAASETATVQLITDLERTINELRDRAVMKPPQKPRLVGGDG